MDNREAVSRVPHHVLRGDAYIDQSRHLKTPFALYPLVVHLARKGGSFTSDHEKRHFLHWMYAALMWGRYSQIVNQIANLAFLTKQANLKISNADPLAYLRDVNASFPGALEQQFVPMDQSLWTVDRFENFLAARRSLIAEGINDFIDALITEEAEPISTIEGLIANGENLGVEYKGSLRWDYRENCVNKELTKSVIKTLAAFMNSQGGTLLIGVMDDGGVVGLERDFESLAKSNQDGCELAFRNAIGSSLGEDVNPYVELTFSQVNGRTVAVAFCEGHHKPVFVEEGDRAQFYVRAGNTSRPLDVREASEYIRGRWRSATVAA